MYGGPSKLARAGGGAGRGASGKRPPSSFPLPPAHRPSGRLSLGGGGAGSGANPRNRTSTAAKSEAPLSVEENFSLVTGNNPLAFAMIIRLAPDLIEEIKRVESQGGTPRIKFDANAKNSSGNVIDVGGKEFRFTWSREVGDLCDIYEERKSGEDGSGLLVESGNAWRKVNVQRILDESTTNHVKKLSEEAERRSKSRRAIVLEPGNPSMKNQIKQLAAAESLYSRHGNELGRPVEESRSLSPYPDEFQERQNFIGSLFEDRENTVVDSARHEQSDSTDRISKGKSKRSSELECFEENAVHTKRLKLESSSQQPVSGNWGAQLQSSRNLSPSKLNRDSSRNPTSQVTNKGELKGNSDFRPKMGNKEIVSEKNCSDVSQASWRPHDQSGVRAVDTAVRPDKHGESIGRGGKHSEKGGHANESFHAYKDRFYGNVENEGMNEKKVSRNSRSGGPGDKQIQPCDSHLSKPGDIVGKFKDGKTFSSSQMGYSPRDNNNRISADRSPVNGKGRILQREHSDLELGELREPFPEEALGKKKFERNNSSKQLENKGHTSDIWSSELNKGKSNLKASLDNGKRSSPHISTKFPSNPEVSNKKKISEHKVEDLTRVNHRPPQSHPQGPQYSSRVDHVEVEKPVDANVKPNQGIGPESCGESNRKASVGISQLHDMKREQLPSKKGSKRQAPNQITEVTDALKNPISAEHENSDLKRRDSSSDENSCSYSKYEKDEPELKGAIKDFSQYKEYVQEYRDKYECYLSLNKILESYRAEFCKLGKELDSSRGQDSDKYFNLLGQLKESYRLCSTRHKRLKKIFIVLHEELKHLKERIKDFAQTYAKD
ncbi:hypothetical protein SDJN02_00061, partial [Cucurbita argyrosperma subsp. argyrosperma]